MFRAEGTPLGLGLALFGFPAAAPISLALLGLPGQGCTFSLDPLGIVASLPAVFEPEVHPFLQGVATAEVLLQVPAEPTGTLTNYLAHVFRFEAL